MLSSKNSLNIKWLLTACTVLTIAIFFSACSHYKLGSMCEVPFCTLYVAPVKNKSVTPQAQALLTQQIIEAFNRDSTVRITQCEEDADATLSITLTDLQKSGTAYNQSDTGVALAFSITLSACISLNDNCSTRAYFANKCVSATVETYVNDSLQMAEYQNMPELTRKLAQVIRDQVLNIW